MIQFEAEEKEISDSLLSEKKKTVGDEIFWWPHT